MARKGNGLRKREFMVISVSYLENRVLTERCHRESAQVWRGGDPAAFINCY